MKKRIGCMVMALVLAAALAACGTGDAGKKAEVELEAAGIVDAPTDEGNGTDGADDKADAQDLGDASALQGLEGLSTLHESSHEARSGVLAGDTYYNITYPVDSYNNPGQVLYKTDLSTLRHTALDSIEEAYGATMFLSPKGEVCAIASGESSSTVYRLGAGDKLEVFIESDYSLRGEIATDGSFYYTLGYTADSTCWLLRAPVGGGSFEEIAPLQTEGELVGAANGLLYLFVGWEDDTCTLVALSPVDGQTAEVYKYTAWPGMGILVQDTWYHPAYGEGAASVLAYELATGDVRTVAEVPNVAELWISSIWGGRLFVTGFDMDRSEPPYYDYYTLDPATGSLSPMEIRHKNDDTHNVEMLAETADSFLVTHSYNWFKTTTEGKDGGSYPVEDMYRGFGLISKSDFWANNQSFTDIEMNT